ncbi:MerR family transcriptional regulator [Paenibacillus apiarius]|uniref:MerR family transcriptional regulator n=1 Tax=Paenibacillus apiarius TaxID=46240 RepID=UPI0019807246|nr:MerR family transcriptional regulator [Paenibacillus apiarius]MBN3526857.1 MerR family transcriptional regulator [Paenibacillus apiarius]
MRISDLSRLTGVSIRSLRYYEEKELLSPVRTESGYREYDAADVVRVRKIQFYLQLGVRTEELAHLFR